MNETTRVLSLFAAVALATLAVGQQTSSGKTRRYTEPFPSGDRVSPHVPLDPEAMQRAARKMANWEGLSDQWWTNTAPEWWNRAALDSTNIPPTWWADVPGRYWTNVPPQWWTSTPPQWWTNVPSQHWQEIPPTWWNSMPPSWTNRPPVSFYIHSDPENRR